MTWPKSARHATKDKHTDFQGTQEDWEQFVRDNAVVLVREKNATIARLRKIIRELSVRRGNRNRRLRAEIEALKKQIEGHAERIAKQSDLLTRRAETKTPRASEGLAKDFQALAEAIGPEGIDEQAVQEHRESP